MSTMFLAHETQNTKEYYFGFCILFDLPLLAFILGNVINTPYVISNLSYGNEISCLLV